MNDYKLHRKALREMLPDGPVLVAGGREIPRNHDVNFVFRQKSHFLYLSGVGEPDYYLLLDPKKNDDTLFIPKVDLEHKVWLGHVPDTKEARERYGVSQVRYADELGEILQKTKRGFRKCYADPEVYRRFSKELGGLKNSPQALEEALQTLRACKTSGELELLQKANDVSGAAHLAVMSRAKAGMREHQLQAVFESVCLDNGLKHQAYPPIVAAGRNSAVLHYFHNDAVLKRGDLFLVDAGAEWDGYAADITRTYPVEERFSQRQRDVYSIVLDVQKQCIDRSRAGQLWGDLHLHAMRVIAEGLRSLGFLRGSTDELVENGSVKIFFPHGLGHMLGLDVHDCPGGRKRQQPTPPNVRVRFNARLEPGFVVTVEPGIYFIEALINDKKTREKHKKQVDFKMAESFLDFGGIRIEDDVVVQPEGPPLNLTKVPKEIADVESACGF